MRGNVNRWLTSMARTSMAVTLPPATAPTILPPCSFPLLSCSQRVELPALGRAVTLESRIVAEEKVRFIAL